MLSIRATRAQLYYSIAIFSYHCLYNLLAMAIDLVAYTTTEDMILEIADPPKGTSRPVRNLQRAG